MIRLTRIRILNLIYARFIRLRHIRPGHHVLPVLVLVLRILLAPVQVLVLRILLAPVQVLVLWILLAPVQVMVLDKVPGMVLDKVPVMVLDKIKVPLQSLNPVQAKTKIYI